MIPNVFNSSLKIKYPKIAETGGAKKNRLAVLDIFPLLINNIKIDIAPIETIKISQDIEMNKSIVRLNLKGSVKLRAKAKNIAADIACIVFPPSISICSR